MIRSMHFGWASAVVLAASICAFTPGIQAQSPQQTQPQQPSAQPQPQSQAQQQSATFAGTILKLPNGKYALATGKTPEGQTSGHFLDDQANAMKFEGKKVTVTGTLDPSSNVIHVSKIEAP